MSTPFRIAIRQEGNQVNAYMAPMNSMQGAKLLASLEIGFAKVPGVFDAFQAFMKQGCDALLVDVTGKPADRYEEPVAAPQHEKAGHA